MTYTGIDYHKRYSVASSQNTAGARLAEAKIDGNHPEAFRAYFRLLPAPHHVVIEACWNWPWLHDLLLEIEGVERVVVAHPGKTRIIGEAQIKTDRIDARALCTLLRGNLIYSIHVPAPKTRERKNQLRQRLGWSRLRTQIRNRVHALLARQRDLKAPQMSDLFGVKGRAWLRSLVLPGLDDGLLKQQLELMDLLDRQMKEIEAWIINEHSNDVLIERIQSLPGMGRILGAVVALEIEDISRFTRSEKLCAYAGLVPSTRSSGGKIHHGRALNTCNHFLQWAFVEASWIAVGCDAYFGDYYRRQRARGKQANTAIMCTARRMCQITWAMLHNHRDYLPLPIPISPVAAYFA
jgi:transposase